MVVSLTDAGPSVGRPARLSTTPDPIEPVSRVANASDNMSSPARRLRGPPINAAAVGVVPGTAEHAWRNLTEDRCPKSATGAFWRSTEPRRDLRRLS